MNIIEFFALTLMILLNLVVLLFLDHVGTYLASSNPLISMVSLMGYVALNIMLITYEREVSKNGP